MISDTTSSTFAYAEKWFESFDKETKEELNAVLHGFSTPIHPILILTAVSSKYWHSLSDKERAELRAKDKNLGTVLGFARYYAELPPRIFVRGLHGVVLSSKEEIWESR